MSEATSLPVYIQISEMLMREIIAGRLSDGERLLPERHLAKSLNISVGTPVSYTHLTLPTNREV